MELDEFIQHMDAVQKAYPLETEEELARGARKIVREAKKNSPDSNHDSKRKISKSWKMRIKGTASQALVAEVYNASPHYHLVERGHVMKTIGGRVKGFKQGTFFFKKTVDNNIEDVQTGIQQRLFKAIEDKL